MLKRLALALLLCAGNAQAWTLEYTGTLVYAYGPGCQLVCPSPVVFPWSPVITFETTDGAVTSVAMEGGIASFDTSDPSWGTTYFGNFSATITNGHVASFAGMVLGPSDMRWSLSAESVSFDLFAGGASYGGFATAAPNAPAVPEPSTYLLLLGGLGLLGAVAHRRKLKSAP